jgi:hypothetical protein
MFERRTFLVGLASILVAPAIVRAENLMPIRALTSDLLYVEPVGTVIHSATILPDDAYLWMSCRRDGEIVDLNQHRLFSFEFIARDPMPMPRSVYRQPDGTIGLSRNTRGIFRRPDGSNYAKENGVIYEIPRV